MFTKIVYGLDLGDVIAEVECEFSTHRITTLLLRIGLLPEWISCYEERFERFVFCRAIKMKYIVKKKEDSLRM